MEIIRINPETGARTQVFNTQPTEVEAKAYELKQAGYEVQTAEDGDELHVRIYHAATLATAHETVIEGDQAEAFAKLITEFVIPEPPEPAPSLESAPIPQEEPVVQEPVTSGTPEGAHPDHVEPEATPEPVPEPTPEAPTEEQAPAEQTETTEQPAT